MSHWLQCLKKEVSSGDRQQVYFFFLHQKGLKRVQKHLACISESKFYFNCTGSSLQCVGFSSCGVWAREHADSVVATLMSSPALQRVGS